MTLVYEEDYYTVIYDLNTFHIIKTLKSVFNAQKMFYFGNNNEKYLNKIYGLDKCNFIFLNLENMQENYRLEETSLCKDLIYNLFLEKNGKFYSLGKKTWSKIDEENKNFMKIECDNVSTKIIDKNTSIYQFNNYYILFSKHRIDIVDIQFSENIKMNGCILGPQKIPLIHSFIKQREETKKEKSRRYEQLMKLNCKCDVGEIEELRELKKNSHYYNEGIAKLLFCTGNNNKKNNSGKSKDIKKKKP